MNETSGIALDIDDTLADTLGYFVRLLEQKFPNPEKLTTEELIVKYKIIPHMMFWQTPEIKLWLEEQALSEEILEKVPPISGALDAVQKINTVVPVRMYITSRPSIVADATKRWLQKNNFPDAEVVTRPHSMRKIDGNAWKADILKKIYPDIVGIVDDNPEIVGALENEYQGTVFLYGNHFAIPTNSPCVVSCPTWDDVWVKIQEQFQRGDN